MNKQNEAQNLPDGWVLCKSKSNPGRTYYFNKKTGKSSWTKPQGNDGTDQKKSKKQNAKRKANLAKKEEQAQKSLKRKSEGYTDASTSKKSRKDASRKSDSHVLASSLSKDSTSPTKKAGNRNKQSPSPLNSQTSSLKKNIASSRLAKLREQLIADSKESKESQASEKSPTKLKSSPVQTEIAKTPRRDIKSPNESKPIQIHSPNDNSSPTPSPSQFLAANKIISSIKAQLPDKYERMRQKDLFADLEKDIRSQNSDGWSSKHPSTPPQFSEASKLVSAIKSKLSYKSSPIKDIKVFTSAQERLENLRNSLSEVNDSIDDSFLGSNNSFNTPQTPEAMEVDREMKSPPFTPVKITQNADNTTDTAEIADHVTLVVDTNIFIHELAIIKVVLNAHIEGYSEQPTLLVPWRVINELDKLKDNNNGNGAVCKRARAAMDYLYKSLPENSRIKGQSLRDANSHIYPCELPDDEILNCCLQQKERGTALLLLTNDKNLANKAAINGVKSINMKELQSLMVNKPRANADPKLSANLEHYTNTIYQLLANILENEMRAKYNNLWKHVLFKAPPWTLADVVKCLLKHWIAVFNDVFPRIEHLFSDMKTTLACIQSKDPKSLSESEVSNFKELCLDIAKKCQIIPEYMELAKLTVERLSKTNVSETTIASGKESTSNSASETRQSSDYRVNETETGSKFSPSNEDSRTSSDSESETDMCSRTGSVSENGELIVIEAFERVWTLMSSFCAKLSTYLGVLHALEDKLPSGQPIEELSDKWQMLADGIMELDAAMKRVLSAEDDSDPDYSESVLRLESVLKGTLTMTSSDTFSIDSRDVMSFCTKCRNMLHEASLKFSELTRVLDLCKDKINSM